MFAPARKLKATANAMIAMMAERMISEEIRRVTMAGFRKVARWRKVRFPLDTLPRPSIMSRPVPVVVDAVNRIMAYKPCASLAVDKNDWSKGLCFVNISETSRWLLADPRRGRENLNG